MHGTGSVGILLGALVGVVISSAPPVSATTYKAVTFTGSMDLSTGLGYPCTTSNLHQCPPDARATVKTGPKNEPQVSLVPDGNAAGFFVNTALCVKTSGSTPDKAPPKHGADLCAMSAAGVVTGFCGLATGVGMLTLVNLTGSKAPISIVFTFTGVAGVLHVTGGNKATNLYAEVLSLPEMSAPAQPTCTHKLATRFILTGTGIYKDCTQETTAGVCKP